MKSSHIPTDVPAYWFVFTRGEILQVSQENGMVPMIWQDMQYAHAYHEQILSLGEHDGLPCFMLDVGSEVIEHHNVNAVPLRALFFSVSAQMFQLVAKAWQYALFIRTHRFCGQCGGHMELVDWELAVHCHTCQHRCYPRVSPCIIVAIIKDRSLLLAQGKPQKERNMYSTIAGFVESGETLEQAVHREIKEEVGVNVKNLRYISSQPWPFPHSLMMGYLAQYDSGEIKVDGKEILDAHWFDIDDLPNIPPKISIAGQLIEMSINEINEQK